MLTASSSSALAEQPLYAAPSPLARGRGKETGPGSTGAMYSQGSLRRSCLTAPRTYMESQTVPSNQLTRLDLLPSSIPDLLPEA